MSIVIPFSLESCNQRTLSTCRKTGRAYFCKHCATAKVFCFIVNERSVLNRQFLCVIDVDRTTPPHGDISFEECIFLDDQTGLRARNIKDSSIVNSFVFDESRSTRHGYRRRRTGVLQSQSSIEKMYMHAVTWTRKTPPPLSELVAALLTNSEPETVRLSASERTTVPNNPRLFRNLES